MASAPAGACMFAQCWSLRQRVDVREDHLVPGYTSVEEDSATGPAGSRASMQQATSRMPATAPSRPSWRFAILRMKHELRGGRKVLLGMLKGAVLVVGLATATAFEVPTRSAGVSSAAWQRRDLSVRPPALLRCATGAQATGQRGACDSAARRYWDGMNRWCLRCAFPQIFESDAVTLMKMMALQFARAISVRAWV